MDLADKTPIIASLKHNTFFPILAAVHSIDAAMALRKELGDSTRIFASEFPLACWVSTMMLIFSGSMAINALLGMSILGPLANTEEILVGTISWLLIFYSPMEYGFRFANYKPIKIVLGALAELVRTQKIYNGVARAVSIYPNGWMVIVIIGTLSGNGEGFKRFVQSLLHGEWMPGIILPSYYTKTCFLASVIFTVQLGTNYLVDFDDYVYLLVLLLFIYVKVFSIIYGPPPFEQFLRTTFSGRFISLPLGTVVIDAEESNNYLHFD